MVQFSKLDFWQMLDLSFLPNLWYHFYIWVDCGGYMSSGDVSWWVSINNIGVRKWYQVCMFVTLVAGVEGRKSQVQINVCISCHCARVTSSVLTNIFLVSSSGILKPNLGTKKSFIINDKSLSSSLPALPFYSVLKYQRFSPNLAHLDCNQVESLLEEYEFVHQWMWYGSFWIFCSYFC